jgi:hypothetical protein
LVGKYIQKLYTAHHSKLSRLTAYSNIGVDPKMKRKKAFIAKLLPSQDKAMWTCIPTIRTIENESDGYITSVLSNVLMYSGTIH